MLGSVRLFASAPETEALEIEAQYLACLQMAVSACGGVVKTAVADEVLGEFVQADDAWRAACQIHRQIGELGNTLSVRLSCRLGLHRQGVDESPELAERRAAWIGAHASGGQMLASRAFLASLTSSVQSTPASLIVPSAPSLAALAVDVVLLLNSSNSFVREGKASTTRLPLAPAQQNAVAHLIYDKAHYFLEAGDGRELRLGRDPSAGIVIVDRRVSRQHGRLLIRDGRIFYIDTSTNGSFVSQGTSERFVRHEEVMLRQSGKICFGGSANDPASPCLTFEIL